MGEEKACRSPGAWRAVGAGPIAARKPMIKARPAPNLKAGAIGVFCRKLPSEYMRPPTRTVGKMIGIAAEANACCGNNRASAHSSEPREEVEKGRQLSTKTMVCPVSTS